MTVNTSDKAEEFNNFYASVGKNTYEQPQQTLGQYYTSSVDFPASDNENNTERIRPKSVDTDTIILTIKSLMETRSVGSDSISHNLIKGGLFVIAIYLTCIINSSLVTGTFPQAWKHHFVIPVFFFYGDPDKVNATALYLFYQLFLRF